MHSLFKNKIVRDSAIFGLGTLVIGVFGYLFQFIIARKLSVAEYGEFQILNSTLLIFGVVSSALSYFFLKFTPVFAKAGDYASHSAFIKWALKKTWAALGLFSVIFLILIPPLYLVFHLTNIWGLLFVMLAVATGIWGMVYRTALWGWEFFLLVSVAGAIGAIGKLVAGYIISFFSPGASSVSFSLAVGSILTLFFYFLLHKKVFAGTKRGEENKNWREKYYVSSDIRKSVYQAAFFSLLIALLGNADILLAKSIVSAEFTGFYGALRILGSVILTLNLAVIGVVLPGAFAEGHERKSLGGKTILIAYGLIALVSGGGLLLFALFPKILIGMLFGVKYLSLAPYLWMFALLAFFSSLLQLEASLAYARHDYRVSLLLLFTLVLMVFGVYFYHGNIRDIVLAVTVPSALGYFSVLFMNLAHRRAQFLDIVPT